MWWGIRAYRFRPKDYTSLLPEEQRDNPYTSMLKSVQGLEFGPLAIFKPSDKESKIAMAIGMKEKPTYPLFFFQDIDNNKIPDWIDISDKNFHIFSLRDKNEDGVFDFITFGKINGTDVIFLDRNFDGRLDDIILKTVRNTDESLSIHFDDTWYSIVRKDGKICVQNNQVPIKDKHGIKIFYMDGNKSKAESIE